MIIGLLLAGHRQRIPSRGSVVSFQLSVVRVSLKTVSCELAAVEG
jgi:hypothetical protein